MMTTSIMSSTMFAIFLFQIVVSEGDEIQITDSSKENLVKVMHVFSIIDLKTTNLSFFKYKSKLLTSY